MFVFVSVFPLTTVRNYKSRLKKLSRKAREREGNVPEAIRGVKSTTNHLELSFLESL
jgi:hypothetical protein